MRSVFRTSPWAVAFFLLLAFTTGTLVGQVFHTARAQQDDSLFQAPMEAVKIQLDTSNCRGVEAQIHPNSNGRLETSGGAEATGLVIPTGVNAYGSMVAVVTICD